ncbi:MAG: WG repeat-containing protein [Bacteroidota bacterium]
MPKYLLIALLSWPLLIQAQSNCEDAAQIIRLAERDLANRTYERAINRLLDARDICAAKKDQVNRLIKQAFQQIEGEKRSAKQAQIESDKQQKRADSSLSVAEQVLDQMYFYEGKFGLTLKKIDSVESPFDDGYRYGFIDRSGKTMIPFEFEKASAFSSYDGFARVSKNQKKYLLDTAGELYLLAESFDELRPEIEALDLRKVPIEALPENIGDYSKLEVLILPNLYQIPGLLSLPNSISKLTQLKYLNLLGNSLSALPSSFGNLQALEHLSLQYNHFEEVPSSLGTLRSLEIADLRYNQITKLPPFYFDFDIILRLDEGESNVVSRESVISLVDKFEKDCNTLFNASASDPDLLLKLGTRLLGLVILTDFSDDEKLRLYQILLRFTERCYKEYPDNKKVIDFLGYNKLLLAEIYFVIEQFDDALKITQQATVLLESRQQKFTPSLDSKLQLTDAYELLVLLHRRADFYQASPFIQKWLAIAQSLFDKYPNATEVIDDYYDALYYQAYQSLLMREFTTAERAAKKALGLKQEGDYIHSFLIQAYVLQGKLEQAQQHFDNINTLELMVEDDESLKQSVLQQLEFMEVFGIYKSDDPNVGAFRDFLETRK